MASTVSKAVEPLEGLRVLPPSASDDGVFRDCLECPEMVLLPAGSFMVGSALGEGTRDESGVSQRRVEISGPFAVSKYEITRGEFGSYVEDAAPNMSGGCEHFNMQEGESRGDDKRSWRSPGYGQVDRHPVACVNWHDAKAYVDWLSKRTGENYRLLSEAEWEYAARGFATGPFHSGAPVRQQEHANYGGYHGGTVEVGSFPPNALGLHDIQGNVFEWVGDCLDYGHDDDNGPPLNERTAGNDQNCPGSTRVVRGGSWRSSAYSDNVLSDFHPSSRAGTRSTDVGFRVARTIASSHDCPAAWVKIGSGCLRVPDAPWEKVPYAASADSEVTGDTESKGSSEWGEPETVGCFQDYRQRAVSLGHFASRETGESRTQLILSNDEHKGCVILNESGGQPVSIFPDWASFEAVCRDPVSGLDHAVMRTATGNSYSSIEVWAIDLATGTPKAVYNEAWTGGMLGEIDDGWGLDLLVATDGTCLWRKRKTDRERVNAGMSALRIGTQVILEPAKPTVLPARTIADATAHSWLRVLEESGATLEGPVYTDEAGEASWGVVQVLGTTQCDAEGVVLVLDRRKRTWRAIHDVPSGCSKELNFPMRGMTVEGSRLFASICSGTCDSLDDYQDFMIELDTDLATPLDWGTVRKLRIEWEETTGSVGFLIKENRPIRDVEREMFLK